MRVDAKCAFATAVFSTLLICTSSAPARPDTTVTYDPSLGTLPEAQDFAFHEFSGASPPPSVTGGILHQGTTSAPGVQYWDKVDVQVEFGDGFALEATLKVIGSTYNPNANGPGSQRSGYYLEAFDELGRRFTIGIDGGGITVNTDATLMTTNGIQRIPFDATDAFHEYRLTVESGLGSLYIDDTLFGSTPVGGVVDTSLANLVLFGDLTNAGNSTTQLSGFRYTIPTATAVREPTTLDGAGEAAGIGRDKVWTPWPNPWSDPDRAATFAFTLAAAATVSLDIFDVQGRIAARYGSERFETPGLHMVTWSPGGLVPGGYFVRLATDRGSSVTTTFTVLR